MKILKLAFNLITLPLRALLLICGCFFLILIDALGCKDSDEITLKFFESKWLRGYQITCMGSQE